LLLPEALIASPPLKEQYGDKVLLMKLDVDDKKAVDETINKAFDHFGTIDVVILTVSGCAFGEQMGQPKNVKMINELLYLASEGKFAVPIDQVFPFDDIDAAHTRAEQRGRFGRVIVTV
jgi:NADPH:quinone reductase-like Zn-dependent oxidoreductase